MAQRTASRRAQRGAALIVFATVLILGVAWFAVGALGKAAPTPASREIRTGEALQAAKRALLGYTAQYAARTDHDKPGRLPCPESLSAIGTANEGQAATSCSNTVAVTGRLPWKTLGIDRLVDGASEPLWYVLSPGFRGVSPTTAINFGTPAQLALDGSAGAAVALIIAPGTALNTQLDPDTPPGGCAKRNQSDGRSAASLNALNFMECGNATGNYITAGSSKWMLDFVECGNATGNYTAGCSKWFNDRVLAITAAEWIDAIAGPVADRLQRQVAPALADWRENESNTWGELFLPAASTFTNPATNDLCGDGINREGLIPVARSALSSCTGWTGGNVTQVLGLLGSANCTQVGTNYVCTFLNLSIVPPLLNARVTAQAPNVGRAFRRRLAAADINVSHGGAVNNFSLSFDPTTAAAGIDFRISFPFLLSFGAMVTVTIPNMPDANILSDPRMAWFVTNDWARHTYYAVARGSQLDTVAEICSPAPSDIVYCMILNGLPPSSGSSNVKRFVIALMGPALSTQTQPNNDRNEYIESRTNLTTYHQDRIDSVFNDRLATCPFKYQNHINADVVICN